LQIRPFRAYRQAYVDFFEVMLDCVHMFFSQTIPLSKFIPLFKTHFEKVLHIGCADMILAVLDLCADLEHVCVDCRQAWIKDEEWWD